MTKKPPEKKGFAGFDSLASDNGDDAPEAVTPPEPAIAPEQTEETPEPAPIKILEKVDELDLKEPLEKFKKGGYWWLIIGGIVVWVILSNVDKKEHRSSYTPTTQNELREEKKARAQATQEIYQSTTDKYKKPEPPVIIQPEPEKTIAPAPIISKSASFDCTAAKSTLELLICADSELASLDGQVGTTYSAVLKSSTDKNLVLSAQREFLKKRTDICTIPFNANISEYEANNIIGCLKILYKSRLQTLEKQSAAATSPTTKTTPSDTVSKATGLIISRVDAQGRLLTTNDYNYGGKFVVNYQGKTILEDDSSAYVNFESLYLLGDEQVVMLSQASGGNACNATYRLISIANGIADVSKEFGNCSQPEITQTPDNELAFVFYDGYGKRLINLYKNRQLTERKVNVPLKTDPNSADGFRYLKKYASKNDVESMLQDRKLNPKMVNMLGANWEGFKQRLDLYNVNVTDAFIIVSGQMAHSGGSDEAILMIGLDGSQLYAATLETDYDVKPPVKNIKAYSNQPSLYSVAPQEMQNWVANFKTPNVHWKYAK